MAYVFSHTLFLCLEHWANVPCKCGGYGLSLRISWMDFSHMIFFGFGFAMLNILFVPMLISGILCTLISIVTWLFRRREKINTVFSFFTLTLAIDSFAFFLWFQFGHVEDIKVWMRFTFTAGFLVPLALIFFFFAFTGYDNRLDEKVLGIQARHFRIFAIVFVIGCMMLAQFTDLLIKASENPQHIGDVAFGVIGNFMFPLYACIFVYLFSMAFKSYRVTVDVPQKRFILLLAVGTLVWLLFGYVGALIFPTTNDEWQAITYVGTGLMAVSYFVAIVNYQSDKVYEMNVTLEQKVEDRTLALQEKNEELEETLDQLQQMQKQVIVQEKMATLGQLVAGLTHEMNTPLGAIRSMNDTKSKAAEKLLATLQTVSPDTVSHDAGIQKVMKVMSQADALIVQGTDRLREIVDNLKNFSRLDEAETMQADIHEGIESVLSLIQHDLLQGIEVVRDYGDVPPILCQPSKLNQLFLNVLKNAGQAMDGQGQVVMTTRLQGDRVQVAIADTGRGIAKEDLDTIFDPVFTTRGAVVRARLGLSICHQIVQEHHGHISVASDLGKGTTVTVVLPLTFHGDTRTEDADHARV